MPSQPAAFVSYARFNDQHDDGWVSQFCDRLGAEVQVQLGEEFPIFQDRKDIAWGQSWQKRINEALDTVTLLPHPIAAGNCLEGRDCQGWRLRHRLGDATGGSALGTACPGGLHTRKRMRLLGPSRRCSVPLAAGRSWRYAAVSP